MLMCVQCHIHTCIMARHWQYYVLVCVYLYICIHECAYMYIWEKGALGAKCDFLPLFNLPPFRGSRSPRLQTWFVSTLGLLLHRSNGRSLSKPPVPNGEPPKWGMKWRFSNEIDAAARPPPPHRMWAGPTICSECSRMMEEYIHARFEVHRCYGSRDISVLKQKFRKCAKCPLFSNPVTYNILWVHRVYFYMLQSPTNWSFYAVAAGWPWMVHVAWWWKVMGNKIVIWP